MRRAVTIGYRHDSGVPEIIHGPEVPLAAQKVAMQKVKAAGNHDDFAKVELWTSDAGVFSHKKLTRPGDPSKPAPDDAKTDKTPSAPAESKKKTKKQNS